MKLYKTIMLAFVALSLVGLVAAPPFPGGVISIKSPIDITPGDADSLRIGV